MREALAVRCPACRFDNPEPSKFCGRCGQRLERPCSACGSRNPPDFEFCGECGASLTQSPPPRPAATGPRTAERRQVTVLFADLVGSTAIAGQIDPEDLRKLVRTYTATCAAVVQRYAGHVAQFMGDGMLAYFGFPTAHEDDAERAVRAGLGIVEAVSRLDAVSIGPVTIRLAVRVGIATGLVVVGDPIGTHPGEDSGVVGETPNLAARLQAVAEPNTVVIPAETRRLLGDRFSYEDLGSHELKGFARPVRVWRVVRPDETLSRFEAAHRASLTPLVGREEDLAFLLRRWAEARMGRGQVALLAGEPGIGKSRMAQTLGEKIAPDAPRVLVFQCSPHHTNSALYPVITQLERLAGFDRDDSVDRRLAKIAALLGHSDQPAQSSASLLASLLSLPTEHHFPPMDVSPRFRRELTLAVLQSLIEGLAKDRPLLLVFEDVHWIDPTSQELLDLLIEKTGRVRALVIVTFRPSYAPPWTALPHVTFRVLNRLSGPQAAELVGRVAGGKTLPREVHDQIVAKTDGVPLFIEELTKTVIESGWLQEQDDRYVVSGATRSLSIPATLSDSLLARLDQLGPGREVAQIGSVIGRQFTYELLAAVASMPESELRAALDQLVNAELVFCHGTPPHASYTFKHALVQDAAYESLLLASRQALHGRIVDVLESRFPEAGEGSPEILAHHCTEARLTDQAVHYWHVAGRRASERSAYLEAISHLTRGLDLVAGPPETPERRRRELDLLIALGPVLINTRGPRTREVAHAYSRALGLCAALPESPQHFAALWGSWRISESFEAKRDLAEKLLALAERLEDPGLRLQAYHCLWASLFHLGQHEACCEHVEKGLRLYEAGDYRTHGAIYGGHDPKVCGIGDRAFALWLLGFPDRALAASHESMAWARRLGHAGTLVHALDMCLLLHRYRRDAQAVQARAEELLKYSEDHGFSVHRAKGQVFLGWALAELGQIERGIEHMRQGIEAQQAIGTREDFPILFDMLAAAYAAAGESQARLGVLDEALAETERSGLRYWTAELHRSRGDTLLTLSPEREAEAVAELQHALKLAREQRAKSLELRAAMSLARLERRRGEAAAAHALLAPVYGWFKEGFDTVDLEEARALLDELARPAAETAVDARSAPRPAIPE